MDEFRETFIRTAWTQCWQVTLLIVGTWLTVRYAARNRPHLASVLWLVVLIKCVTPPFWSSPGSVFSWIQQPQTSTRDGLTQNDIPGRHKSAPRGLSLSSGEVFVTIDRSPSLVEPVDSNLPMNETQPVRSSRKPFFQGMSTWSGLVAMLWLVGCVTFAVLSAVRGLFCWRRLYRSGFVDRPAVRQLAVSLSRRLGLRRPVKVIVSRSPIGPAVVGFWRPIVILPALIVEAKTLTELEPLLAHEIIHVRRGDLWVGLLQLLAQGLWWFHPLVHWVNRLVTREAECCCDEAVIAYLGCRPAQYARSLIDVLALKQTLQPVPVFPGVRPVDVTSQRLERIMQLGQGCRKQTPRWYWLIMLLAVSATLPGAAFIAAQDKLAPNPMGPVPLAFDLNFPLATDKPQPWPDTVTREYAGADLLERVKQDLSLTDANARILIADHLKRATKLMGESLSLVVDLPPVGPTPAIARLPEPSVNWRGTDLVIEATDADHAKIAEQISAMKENGFEQLRIETRVITGPAAAIDQIVARWNGLVQPVPAPNYAEVGGVYDVQAQGNPKVQGSAQSTIEKQVPFASAIVDAEFLRTLVAKGQAETHTKVLFAPKVVVFNGQQATIVDALQRPFIVGHQATDQGTSPVVRFFKEGWFLTLKPKTLDHDRVRLDLKLLRSEITNVETASLPRTDNQPELTVQVPEQSVNRIHTVVELKPGQNLMIGGLKMDKRARNRNARGHVPYASPQEPFLIVVSVSRLPSQEKIPSADSAVVSPPTNSIEQAVAVVPPATRKDVRDLAYASQPKRNSEPGEVSETEPLQLRIYSVADLVIPVPDASLNRSTIQDPGSSSIRKSVKIDFAPLEDLIVSTIAPDSWDRTGGRGSLKPLETTVSLVVRQTAAVHEELQGLLSQIRTLRDLQVSFSVEPIKLTQADFKAWLERVDGPAQQKLKSGKGRLAVAISSPDAKSMRRISNGDDSVPALKITLMNGQQGELQVAQNDAKAEGVIAWLQLLPSIMPELQRVRLNLTASLSDHAEGVEKKSELVTLNHGESMLVDIAAASWSENDVDRGVPILDKIPHVERLFKNSGSDAQAITTHRQFYLLTPKILLVRDTVEAETPPGGKK